MKKNYGYTIKNYHDNYYFVDENNEGFEVPKSVLETDLNDLKAHYYYDNGSNVYKLLFNNDKSNELGSYYRFILIDFGTTNPREKSQIIDLFNDLIINADFIELQDKVIFVYTNELDIDMKDIVEAINFDFATNIYIYESGKVYCKNLGAFNLLFKAYVQASQTLQLNYMSNSDIIINLIKKDSGKLNLLRPIILNTIAIDSQYEVLVNAMFNNSLNVTKTAKDVFMHRNTINNKLDFIKSETNLNIQKFKDAMAMYWLINAK